MAVGLPQQFKMLLELSKNNNIQCPRRFVVRKPMFGPPQNHCSQWIHGESDGSFKYEVVKFCPTPGGYWGGESLNKAPALFAEV